MNVKDLPKGTKLNCIIRYESMDRTSRIIGLLTPDNEIIKVDGFHYEYTNNYNGGYVMSGLNNEDKVSKLVYDLGSYLHNDSNYFDYKLL